MRAMAEKIRLGHPIKKCFNFLFREPGSSLDRSPAGHGGEDVVETVFSGHTTVFSAELLEHIEEQLSCRTPAGKTWNGRNYIGVAAEMAQGKSHLFELLHIFFDKLRLEERKFNSLREEKMLAADSIAAVLSAKILKQQTLMGGMLVDDQKSFAALAKDVEIV